MKNFLKSILASTIGTFIAILIAVGILFIVSIGFISLFSDAMNNKGKALTESGILYLDLSKQTPDLSNNAEVDFFNIEDKVGVQDIKKLIIGAATDDKIKGIMLEPKNISIAFSSMTEIRSALEEFKTLTNKPIYAYADYYSQSQYFLASAADTIMVNPNGIVEFKGLGIQMPYFKDMLDKLGVDVEVYYVGDFKSATEPFRRNSMSESDRIQKKQFIEDMHDILIKDVAKSRNITESQVRDISYNMSIRNAEDAVTLKFADMTGYFSDFIDMFKDRIGYDQEKKLALIGLQKYYNSKKSSLLASDFDSPIAVVYAEGSIVNEGESPGIISDDKYVKLLRDLGDNEEIKAIVLRVNSGGGSALASDNIWNEIERLKAQGMKVVVSMGDYAASGGYYIACNADKIYAEPSTITGSIGVFGMMFNPQQLMNNKLGIHFDTIQTGRFTNSFSPFIDRNQAAKEIIQSSVEDIYEQFTGRVAEGRSMDIETVKELARGRVYTGTRALELGLVDELGSLNDAIDYAAELIDHKGEITTRSYPTFKDPITQMIEELSGEKAPRKVAIKQLPTEFQESIDYIENLMQMRGVQARTEVKVVF